LFFILITNFEKHLCFILPSFPGQVSLRPAIADAGQGSNPVAGRGTCGFPRACPLERDPVLWSTGRDLAGLAPTWPQLEAHLLAGSSRWCCFLPGRVLQTTFGLVSFLTRLNHSHINLSIFTHVLVIPLFPITNAVRTRGTDLSKLMA
jgi:hypothetical protein